MNSMEKAIVLSSGGLDSTTVLGIALNDGYDAYTLRLNYGQRHMAELLAAQEVAIHYRIPIDRQKTFNIDLKQFGGSALTDSDIGVPKGRDESEMTNIPATYVPGRNLIFLSIAAAYAEIIGARNIFIGVNQLDYSGYPDCRQEFISVFQETIQLALKANVEGDNMWVHTPLISLSKADIIKWGTKLNVPYQLTHSCYDPYFEQRVGKEQGYYACGECDSCILRRKGFEQAGIADPTKYKPED